MSKVREPDEDHLDMLMALASGVHADEGARSPCLTPDEVRQTTGKLPEGRVLQHLLVCQDCRIKLLRQARPLGTPAQATVVETPLPGTPPREALGARLRSWLSGWLSPAFGPAAYRPVIGLIALLFMVGTAIFLLRPAGDTSPSNPLANLLTGGVAVIADGTMGSSEPSFEGPTLQRYHVRQLEQLVLGWNVQDGQLSAESTVALGLKREHGMGFVVPLVQQRELTRLRLQPDPSPEGELPFSSALQIPAGEYQLTLLISADAGALRVGAEQYLGAAAQIHSPIAVPTSGAIESSHDSEQPLEAGVLRCKALLPDAPQVWACHPGLELVLRPPP